MPNRFKMKQKGQTIFDFLLFFTFYSFFIHLVFEQKMFVKLLKFLIIFVKIWKKEWRINMLSMYIDESGSIHLIFPKKKFENKIKKI